MDHPPNGGSFPSSPSTSGSQRQARERPRDSDDESPSQGPSNTSQPPSGLDLPGASADSATTTSSSGVVSSLEETCRIAGKDSESCIDDSTTPGKSPSKNTEQADPLFLSTVESLSGPFTGEALDFRLPCTATEDTPCQIVGHLSAWNEFLFLASLQLQEMPGTNGRLSLVLFRDPVPTFSSLQELHLVSLLVCHLLKTHRCVAHVDLDLTLFKAHRELLSDALRGSPSITSVKLIFLHEADLATAALSLPHLRELEFAGYTQHCHTLIARLSTFLQTTASLATLRVSPGYPEGLSSEDFFRGLAQNRSLTELVLPGHLIAKAPASAQAAFTEWLKNNVSLKRLTVESRFAGSISLKFILQALLKNRSIVAVDFECPEADEPDVQLLLSKIFDQNKVLQIFKLSCEYHYPSVPYFVERRQNKAECDHCLKALVGNHTLEEVALPIDIWDEDQWRELFEALPTKENLKRMIIEVLGRESRPFMNKLCAALKETRACEKVSFNASISEEEFDERFECKAFSSVVVHASDQNGAAVRGILERMPSLGHITWLDLDFHLESHLAKELFSSLASFLGSTRTLKTLSLSTLLDTPLCDSKEALMNGLAANTSLREVRIDVDVAGKDFSVFSEPLADAINASQHISRLHLNIAGDDYIACAFFPRLAAGIADNYTLLDLTASECMCDSLRRPWFEVTDATRRNQDLLTCAADLARGARRDRHCALALERMQGHPELVEKVARLEGVEQSRAATMVRDGRRSLQWAGMHEFMRLAGVVREHVCCHASKDGRMQLDTLNEHCWRALRRYLKLRDIRDPTTGALPPQ